MLQNGIEIFNAIGFEYKKSANQRDKILNGPQFVNYICTITVDGISMKVPFCCNPQYTKPNKLEILENMLLDYYSYTMNKDNIGGFLCELGYNSSAEALNHGIKAFDALKEHCKKMDRLFSKEELHDLDECVTALENGDIRLNDDGKTVDMDGIEEMDM